MMKINKSVNKHPILITLKIKKKCLDKISNVTGADVNIGLHNLHVHVNMF